VLRESSGPVSEKNGFSVVAPTRTSSPSSTHGLRPTYVAIRRLQQFQDDIFYVFADVAGFRQGRRVNDGKRYIQHLRQSLGQERLARAGRTPDDHRRETIRLDEDT